MNRTGSYVDELDAGQRRRVIRALLALVVVVTFGTCGFMIIEEDWGIWQSLYFTLITITTVGYGDYGLSQAGVRFTTILLVAGIATATYAFGQVMQAVVSYQLAWRRRMQKRIDRLRDHFIVCGLGRVGLTVCRRLAEASKPFVVVDRDQNRVEWARLHGYLFIQGAATEDEVLHQAGIERALGVVCAVGSDAENIVITLSARELNPGILIISRADEESAVHKIERAGASHIISPALRGGDDIANLLIRPHLAEFLIQSRHSDSNYQLGDVIIEPRSPLVGQTLREYGRSETGVVFVAIKRASGNTQVRPFAEETFQAGDVVIVAGEPEGIARMTRQAVTATEPECVPV